MKQRLKILSGKISARSERERILLLLAGAVLIVLPFTTLLLQPMWQKKIRLERELVQQGLQRHALAQDADSRVLAAKLDPAAALRARLAELQQQDGQVRASLRAQQKGLVAPEAMVPLLQHLLRGNGKLQLLSLRTLPVAGLSADAAVNATVAAAPPPAAAPAAPGLANMASVLNAAGATNVAAPANVANATSAASAASVASAASGAAAAGAASAPTAPKYLLYRHGVELVLQGPYLDMIGYLDALEAAPGQLFWSKAELDAEQSPNGRLTLTLYTVSLDKKWIAL